MEKKRKVYAPFSLTSEAGVTQTPVEGYIDVNQVIYPTVNTGTVNENGKWAGVKSSDADFFAITTHPAVADGGYTLSPQTTEIDHLDMTGFKNLFIAIKPSNGGNYAVSGVMGPDTNRFANLTPVVAAAPLRGLSMNRSSDRFDSLFSDPADSLTSDAWNIFWVESVLQDQKNLQILTTNNSGNNSDIEVAFLRTI